MTAAGYILLFGLGAIFGSFLNVLTIRYRPEEALFKNVGGRSHCPHCHKILHWYELMPVLSFVVQGGRCRTCRKKISLQYPIVEILSGLIFVFVPMVVFRNGPKLTLFLGQSPALNIPAGFYHELYLAAWGGVILSVLWVLAFLTLLAIAVLDIRLRLIPDELNIFLALGGLGVVAAHFFLARLQVGQFFPTSFLGGYAGLLNFTGNVWFNGLLGLIFGGGFMWLLRFFSRGRGMGFGDVKLGAAAGILMGWPDILPAVLLSFIIGAIISVVLMSFKRESLKSLIPFAPFFVLGVTLVYFFGYDIVNGYFRIFGI